MSPLSEQRGLATAILITFAVIAVSASDEESFGSSMTPETFFDHDAIVPEHTPGSVVDELDQTNPDQTDVVPLPENADLMERRMRRKRNSAGQNLGRLFGEAKRAIKKVHMEMSGEESAEEKECLKEHKQLIGEKIKELNAALRKARAGVHREKMMKKKAARSRRSRSRTHGRGRHPTHSRSRSHRRGRHPTHSRSRSHLRGRHSRSRSRRGRHPHIRSRSRSHGRSRRSSHSRLSRGHRGHRRGGRFMSPMMVATGSARAPGVREVMKQLEEAGTKFKEAKQACVKKEEEEKKEAEEKKEEAGDGDGPEGGDGDGPEGGDGDGPNGFEGGDTEGGDGDGPGGDGPGGDGPGGDGDGPGGDGDGPGGDGDGDGDGPGGDGDGDGDGDGGDSGGLDGA